MINVIVDGLAQAAAADERIIDVINRTSSKVPQVCYHPQLGPIQTCDTCIVEVDGQLIRACATTVSAGISVNTKSNEAVAAQREAFDRILRITFCTARFATTATVTAPSTTPPSCWQLNGRISPID